jgi:hypothetical protein
MNATDLVLRITTAYEQGYGHCNRKELSNPYTAGTPEAEAWDQGREVGADREGGDLLRALKDVLDSLGALTKPHELQNYMGEDAHKVFEVIAKAEGRA